MFRVIISTIKEPSIDDPLGLDQEVIAKKEEYEEAQVVLNWVLRDLQTVRGYVINKDFGTTERYRFYRRQKDALTYLGWVEIWEEE